MKNLKIALTLFIICLICASSIQMSPYKIKAQDSSQPHALKSGSPLACIA